MIVAHLTSRHPSNDARIFKRCVSLLRQRAMRVYYICEEDGRELSGEEDNVKVKKRRGLRQRVFSTWEVLKAACKTDAKVLHFHDPEFLPFLWYARFKGKKVVYDIHENFYVKFQFGNVVKRNVGRLGFGTLEAFGFLFIDGVVAVSESLLEKYSKYRKQGVVVRNVPLRASLYFSETPAKNPNTIYVSGNHSEQRNVTSILRALPLVVKDYPRTKLEFVGKYTPDGYLEQLKSLAKDLNVSEHVTFESMLPYDENFRRASEAGLGLVLYEDNINNRVGIPNRLFEYMAVGLPIIVEDFSELNRIIENYHNGISLDSSDPELLARGIKEVFSNPEEAKEMGLRGREAIQGSLNFETEVKNVVSLYESLLFKKPVFK